MPFSPDFNDIYKIGIKETAERLGAYAERVDEQMFEGAMLERIINQINKADVIVADMTGKNPNVFFEVGYAHALGKMIIHITQTADDIPFDLKHYQHIIYEGKIAQLRTELGRRLEWALAQNPESPPETSPLAIRSANVDIPNAVAGLTVPIVQKHTAAEFGSIIFYIRNATTTLLPSMTHLYLFTESKRRVVPLSFEDLEDNVPSRQAVTAFSLSEAEATDSLVKQYRLPVSLPSMPPGAIERLKLPVRFLKVDLKPVEVALRLRIHVGAEVCDFPFILNYRLRPKVASIQQ
jgi:hypothetical protein